LALDYDLGGSFFCGGYGDQWMWWKSLASPQGSVLNLRDEARRAFFPIMSVSRKFIGVYEDALARGWKGRFEVLAPTIANHFNRSIVDFSCVQPALTC